MCRLTLLSDFGLVTARQYIKVGFERANVYNIVVLVIVEILSEQNVILQCRVLNPGLLRHVGDRTLTEETRLLRMSFTTTVTGHRKTDILR